MRRCHLSQLLKDGLRRTKTDHKSSPCHYVIGELKKFAYADSILFVKVIAADNKSYH